MFKSRTDIARECVKDLLCDVHNKKVRLTFDYDREENPFPYISKCCCKPFAKIVADTLYKTGIFTGVYLEHEAGLTAVDCIIKEDSLAFSTKFPSPVS